MKNIEMDANEIRQNLIATYRRHCRLRIESRRYGNVMKNLEQRDIVWSDVWFAAGMSVESMEDIYDEEYKKFMKQLREQAGLVD